MLMVGDQIMTDIRGANAAGIRNVLVQPIVDTDGGILESIGSLNGKL